MCDLYVDYKWRTPFLDRHIKDYYSSDPEGGGATHFHRVIALHDAPDLEWDQLRVLCPSLTRGWYEISQLPKGDRLDFLHAFWLKQLPFQPHLREELSAFYGRLDDIGVYLVQKQYDDPFHADMVYSLANDDGFFRGSTPATDDEILSLRAQFPDHMLPNDYLAFLKIHDGFSKSMDTGVLQSANVKGPYDQLQEQLAQQQQRPLTDANGSLVNPRSLVPFYESFGMPCFQCFWADWYPQDEMGNVYYSGIEGSVSQCGSPDTWTENLAFPTYLDWLMFYLEQIV